MTEIRRLVADVDTGIDDMLALVYLAGLHRAGEIELAAVTTSAGNTTVCQASRNSRWILDLCGCPDVPVAAGFGSPLKVPLTTTPETHGEFGLGFCYAADHRLISGRRLSLHLSSAAPCTARTLGVTKCRLRPQPVNTVKDHLIITHHKRTGGSIIRK